MLFEDWFYWYAFIVVILALVRFGYCDEHNYDCSLGERFISIKALHYFSDMNLFGCLFVFIIWHLFTPITSLCQFFNWLFHVGRKD